MSGKMEQKQQGKWRAWVAPVIVSVCVFSVLGAASLISAALAAGLAVAIVIVGTILLRVV
mgnify:CR=1 FL=1